jgi:pimeloyl-ACP methyl ester carboxylesterase
MQERKIKYQLKKIFYRVRGEGPAVILLHGFGEDGNVWKNQFKICHGHKLIIPDLPGSGHSEMIDDMSMEGLAAVIHSIVLEEKAEPCTLIGHSMGGYITLAYAEKYGSGLNAFGLFHSSAFADSDEKIETRLKGISFTREHGAPAFLKTIIPNLFSKHTKENKPSLIKEQLKVAESLSAEAVIAYYESMIGRPDRTDVLKLADVPVLFILGKEDQVVPVKDGLQQSHMPKIAQIQVLENSAHMGMMEEVELANQDLVQFLSFIHT